MKAAVVQHPPVLLDLQASLARGVELISEAAEGGAALVVFPETWLPGYPGWVWRLKPGSDMAIASELHRRLAENAVNLRRDGLAPMRDAARQHGVVVVIGFDEIGATASGSSLYNSVAIIDADGRIANVHRKMMPTNPERMVWGFGDARGLRVVDTAAGRIGALICWENYMPLARYALYAQGLEILVSPTWDTGETWLATMRHIAREAGAWVIGVSMPLRGEDVPEGFPAPRGHLSRSRRMDQRRRRSRAPPIWAGRCRADGSLGCSGPRSTSAQWRHLGAASTRRGITRGRTSSR